MKKPQIPRGRGGKSERKRLKRGGGVPTIDLEKAGNKEGTGLILREGEGKERVGLVERNPHYRGKHTVQMGKP